MAMPPIPMQNPMRGGMPQQPMQQQGMGQQPQWPSQGQVIGGLFGSNMLPYWTALALGGTKSDQAQGATRAAMASNQLAQDQQQFTEKQKLAEREMSALEKYRNAQLDMERQKLALASRPEPAKLQREISGAQQALINGLITEDQYKSYVDSLVTEGRSNNQFNISVPSGYMPQLDERGQITSFQPIPGGPAAQEQAQADQRAQTEREVAFRKANIVLGDIDGVARSVVNNPTWTTGIGGRIMGQVPGTEANNAREMAQTVRANIGFDQLYEMRKSSPTGGALGNVTVQELARLESALGSLELSQSPEQIQRNLARVREIYIGILKDAGVDTSQIPPMPGSNVDGYVYMGGDPSSPDSWRKQ